MNRRLPCIVGALSGIGGIFLFASVVSAENGPPTIGIGDVRGGTLLFRSETPGRHIPAPLLTTDVDIRVSGPVAKVTVKQRFLNPSTGWLAGRYVFPLPERAAVNRMAMRSADREVVAEIREREAARRVYQQAQQNGKRAALVEQHRPNVFTTDVANLGPNETLEVEIAYLERLRFDQGSFHLRFPMVVAPRYEPNGKRPHLEVNGPVSNGVTAAPESWNRMPVRHPDDGRINPVALTVHLDAGVKLAMLRSPHHTIVTDDWQDGTGKISLSDKVVPADRDFELVWTPVKSGNPLIALFRETIGDETYVLAMVLPPSPEEVPEIPPRDITFVLDRSGSMAGPSIRQARSALAFALDRLRPVDAFDIIRFSTGSDTLFGGLRPATRNTVAIAQQFVATTEANGGTNMRPALLAALQRGSPQPDAKESRLRQVAFLTDGAVGNEAALFDEIATRIGMARLFTVGIGSAPNSHFMRRAAELGRGSFTYIGNTEAIDEKMRALFRKIERPMATDLAADWRGLALDGGAIDVYPSRLPDLYDGEPVVLLARLRAADVPETATLVVSGKTGNTTWQRGLSLTAAPAATGAGTLWGRERIAALMASLHAGADPATVKQAVIATALRHAIVSRYTSLVATERRVARPIDEPVFPRDVPRNLPAGWQYEKVFGGKPRAQETRLQPTPGRRASAAPATASGAALLAKAPAPSADIAAIRLPAGGTDAPIHFAIGVLCFVVAGVFALRKRYA